VSVVVLLVCLNYTMLMEIDQIIQQTILNSSVLIAIDSARLMMIK